MKRGPAATGLLALASLCAGNVAHSTEPVRYRLTFSAPQHHWMQVEATFAGLEAHPLELRMSRSSPGRYSLHDFGKNVYDVEAIDADGDRLELARPDPYGWDVDQHSGTVTVRYKVYGDQLDGTYLSIDSNHVHLNMPAALMWARGLDDRPATVTLVPPAEAAQWTVATQLFPGTVPEEFTAPNLQYLMDSPVEYGPLDIRKFDIGGQRIRVAVHHDGSREDVDNFVAGLRAIVREHGEVFSEYPHFEMGQYTFLIDYLPYATGDGMEHRNSTVLTAPATIATDRIRLLETASHEFFHSWNVERIRPRSLEPFDFERANLSGELWLGEGFTQYYGLLAMSRARLLDLDPTLHRLLNIVTAVELNPARLVRSPVEMSFMAPFVDRGQPVDRTNWGNTYISYYQYGAAIALALDLSLRERSNGQATLDDYMRALWRGHGQAGGARPGYVDRPYSMADAEARLAEVSDASFAKEFFNRYIKGREVADYERLFREAGLLLRPARAGRAWMGGIRLGVRGGVLRVLSPPRFETPAYIAGLDIDDELRELDGRPVRSMEDVATVLSRRRPGDTVSLVYVDRGLQRRNTMMTLVEDPGLELLPVEATGAPLTSAQKLFRTRWLR